MMYGPIKGVSAGVALTAALLMSGCGVSAKETALGQQWETVRECVFETGVQGSYSHTPVDQRGRIEVVPTGSGTEAGAATLNTCLLRKTPVDPLTGEDAAAAYSRGNSQYTLTTNADGSITQEYSWGSGGSQTPTQSTMTNECPGGGLVGATSYCIDGEIITR